MTVKAIAAALVLGLNFYVYYYMATDQVIPERKSFDEFPLRLGEWRCPEREEMPEKVLSNLGASDYLICSYREPGSSGFVNVYVGYHETQVREEGGGGGENSIHPPEHCLPGSGWDIIDASVVPLELPGLPEGHGLFVDRPHAKRFVIAKGDRRQLVYFWYQSRGRVLAGGTDVIVYRFWDRAWRQRTDGALVRFTIPILRKDEERAEQQFRALAERVAPRLAAYVPE